MSDRPLRVDYQTSSSEYRHWKLRFEGPVATLLADFDEIGRASCRERVSLVV